MPSSPEPLIRLERVSLRYPGAAHDTLCDVDLDVGRGETVCIVGGSGGGKSTLFKLMIGALRPTAGRVVVDGADLAGLSERELDAVRTRFGVMFQRGALLNSLDVAQNVALPLRHHSALDSDTIGKIVTIKLKQVDVLHAASRRVSEISGGMLVRVAIARAMALDPRLLFYDEPSAGLDPITTTRVDQLIERLKRTAGVTNVVVTHVMESVRRIADRVFMLAQGRLIFAGDLAAFLASDDPRVRQFRDGDPEGPDAGQISETSYFRHLEGR